MKGTNSDKSHMSSEHIYTSIQSGDLQTSSSKNNSKRGDNSGSQKRPLIVFSPEKSDTTEEISKDKKQNSKYPKNVRGTRSASPEVLSKGRNFYQPKPPIRVLSLDLLKPSVHIDSENGNNLKILSENMLNENKTSFNDKRNVRNNVLDTEDIAKQVSKTMSKPNRYEFEDETTSKVLNGEESCNSEQRDIKSTNSTSSAHSEHNYGSRSRISTGTKGDNPHIYEQKGDNQHNDSFILHNVKPKNVIDDNFLTETEIREEITSAVLY